LALDRQCGRGLKGTRILLLGVAYKKNVADIRESPSLVLFDLLEARGAQVSFHDPFVPVIPTTREHSALAGRKSVRFDAEELGAYAAVLVATDHDCIDYAALAAHAALIVDTRNALESRGLSGRHIVKA
jgi:UDP-N-acetyl-D-glucosamine dehydrogenase